MLTFEDLDLQKLRRFNTHGAVGGLTEFEGTVMGHISGKALPGESNAVLNHANIYQQLPQAVQDEIKDDHASYDYILLYTAGGAKLYIGLPWIDPATIENISTTFVDIRLREFDDPNFNAVKELLRLRGYKVESISEVTQPDV